MKRHFGQFVAIWTAIAVLLGMANSPPSTQAAEPKARVAFAFQPLASEPQFESGATRSQIRTRKLAPAQADASKTAPIVAVSTLAILPAAQVAGREIPPVALLSGVELRGRTGMPPTVLTREIVRQALLMAARDQFGMLTRDASLGEESESDSDQAVRLELAIKFNFNRSIEVSSQRSGAAEPAEPLWSGQIDLVTNEETKNYQTLVSTVERWSREEFVKVIEQAGFQQKVVPFDEQSRPAAKTLSRLNEISFMPQFAALRELYPALQKSPSSQLLGAVVRAHANLGLQTEFLWTSGDKAHKARALLYAQRLAWHDKESPWARWHRAYGMALAGLHQAALLDLEGQEDDDEAARPRWVDLLEAYCRFDEKKLAECLLNDDTRQLAGLLQFLAIEDERLPSITLRTGRGVLETNPECYLVHDALCNVGGVANFHSATQLGMLALSATLPPRLLEMPELPADVKALLEKTEEEEIDEAKITSLLWDAGKRDSDVGELSWQSLAHLVREHRFAQAWRRANFLRYHLSVPTADFLEAIGPLVGDHQFQGFLQLYGMASHDAAAAAKPLFDQVKSADLDGLWPLFDLMRRLQNDAASQLGTRMYQQRDFTYRELTASLRHTASRLRPLEWKKLSNVSPHAPLVIADRILYDEQLAAEEREAAEKNHGDKPIILYALAHYHDQRKQFDQAEPFLTAYIRVSPDYWAYRRLADHYKQAGKIDDWKETLLGFLDQEDVGLEHARVRVEVARYHMERKEWEEARPFADAAAASYAAWAMQCAAECYEGLGDLKTADAWYERMAERYPTAALMVTLWRQQRDIGDAQEHAEKIVDFVDQFIPSTPPKELHIIGLQYWLAGERRKAIDVFQSATEQLEDNGGKFYNGFFVLLFADEMGDQKVRDEVLKQLSKVAEETTTAPGEIFKLFHKAYQTNEPIDLEMMDRMLNHPLPQMRYNFSYFVGHFLANRGRNEEARKYFQQVVEKPEAKFFATRILASHHLEKLQADDDPK